MKKINQTTLLDQKIADLNRKRDIELVDLKVQFNVVLDSAKPLNIIKQTFASMVDTPEKKEDIKASLLDVGVSFLGGYFSKKILFGNSKSNSKKIFGTVLQYAVTTLIHKYNEAKAEKHN